MKAAIWLRVSTDEQTTANQLAPLTEYAERRGLDVVKVYDISGVSAWKGAQEKYVREVIEDARRGKFEVLLIWALDRLSRGGIYQTLMILDRFNAAGCGIISYQEAEIDTTSRWGELLISIFSTVAAIESDQRSARIKAGIARRKAAGGHVGRKEGSKGRK